MASDIAATENLIGASAQPFNAEQIYIEYNILDL